MAKMADLKITDLDMYGMLGLTMSATTSEIRRAYRKKALECHPDKNPDNAKAAELFHQLTKVLEVLLDESARAAYDKLLKAREAAKQRHHALDARRKRFKEDLDSRCAALSSLSSEEKLKNDIERLRKEGAKLIQDEIRNLQEDLRKDLLSEKTTRDASLCQLKVSWSAESSYDAPQYTQETLTRIFAKYGNILAVAVSAKKALVEFEDPKAAELAVRIEVGFVQNPLTVIYSSSKVRKERKSHACLQTAKSESLTERSIRQAAERKRLIEEMLQEDAAKI